MYEIKLKSDGSIDNILPEPIYQGSDNETDLLILAPILGTATIRFTLPTGEATEPQLTEEFAMTKFGNDYTDSLSGYNCWIYSLPIAITANSGKVYFQVIFVDGAVTTAVARGSFIVQKGAGSIVVEKPPASTWAQIVAKINGLRGAKAWITSSSIKLNGVTGGESILTIDTDIADDDDDPDTEKAIQIGDMMFDVSGTFGNVISVTALTATIKTIGSYYMGTFYSAVMGTYEIETPKNGDYCLVASNATLYKYDTGWLKVADLVLNNHMQTYVTSITNAIDNKVEKNTRDINSLKAIVSNTVVTDTEVSDKYHTRKTGDTLSIIDGAQTRVNKISGNTISSKNLIPYPYAFTSSTANGLTYTVNANGSITIKGTTTVNNAGVDLKIFYLPAGTYTVSGYNRNIIITTKKYNSSTSEYENWIDSISGSNQTGTLTEYTEVLVQLYFETGTGVNINTTVFPMLNAGSTALPYYQYFSGLKNAGFKSILSTGKNLVNTDGLFEVGTSYGGLTCSKNADGTYKLSGTAIQIYWYSSTFVPCRIPKGSTIYFTPYYDITTSAEASDKDKVIGLALYNKNGILIKQWNSNIYSGVTTSLTATDDIEKAYFVWRVVGSTGLDVTFDNIKFMLSYENTNVFEPYKSDSITCASNLELSEFDYAVPAENKVYRQSETITFDGSSDESWTFLTYNSTFISGGITHAPITSLTEGIVANMPDVKWTLTDINSKIELPSSSVGNVTTEGDLRTYLATHNLVVTYKKNIVTTEDVSFDKADYTAYLNGSESVMQGDNNTGDYGEECTVDQNFYVKNEV